MWRKIDKTFLLLLGGLVLGVLIGVFLLGILSPNPNPGAAIQEGKTSSFVGKEAPDFELESLTGERVKLSDYSGMPVIINFWATWCPPCRDEMPLLERRYEKSKSQMALLAVNFEEDEEDVLAFSEQFKLKFPLLLDTDGKIAEKYRVVGMPTTFFLDNQGWVRAVHFGSLSDRKLSEYLEKIGVIDD